MNYLVKLWSNINRESLYFLPVFLLCILFTCKALDAPLSDFEGYYFGSKFLINGMFNADVYFPTTFNFNIYKEFNHLAFISYSPFPPFTAIFFIPFSIFAIHEAKLIFNICSMVLFIFTLYRLYRYFNLPGYSLLSVVILYIPIRNNVLFGQAYLILVFLLSEGFIAYCKGKLIKSALYWSLAILLKAFPVILFAYLLSNRSWKAAGWLALFSMLLFFASFIFIEPSIWVHYLFNIMPRLANGELNNSFEKSFQSMFMLLRNLFAYDKLNNIHPLLESPIVFALLWGIYRAGIWAACFSLNTKEKEKRLPNFAVWIMASLLLSPNGSTYSLLLLFFPLIAACPIYKQKPIYTVFIAALIFLVANLPWKIFIGMPMLFQFPRLYLFVLLFILVLVIHNSGTFNWKYFAFFSCLFVLPFYVFPKKKEVFGVYYLDNDKHFFIHSLRIKKAQLWYAYWSPEGLQWQPLNIVAGTNLSRRKVYLKDNQVYLDGKQITDSHENKREPILVKGNKILYLSDKDRGIGFFTIRSIDVH